MFVNPNQDMYDQRNQTVSAWGKDNTGKIKYTFDQYGFRNHNDYKVSPKYVFFGCSLLFGIGVENQDVFTSKFQCWNFGLAGKYSEDEILECFNEFKKLQIDCKIVFVWRNKDMMKGLTLPEGENIYHCLPYRSPHKQHLRLLQTIDHDASGTHFGPKSHLKFSKLLWHFLK